MRSLLILDFDGVLADTFDTFYPMIKEGMGRIGISLTLKQYRDLFWDNFHKKLEAFIDDEYKLDTFLNFRRKNYDKYYYSKNGGAKLFPEASKFIRESKKKYIMTIAS